MITTSKKTNCRAGASNVFDILANLSPGVSVEVRGQSPDGQWWYIQNPERPKKSCWVPTNTTAVSGDISQIPVMNPQLPIATLTLVPPHTPTRSFTAISPPPTMTETPSATLMQVDTPSPSPTLAEIDTPTPAHSATSPPSPTLAEIDKPTPSPSATLAKVDTPTWTATTGVTAIPSTPIGTP